MKHIEYMIPFIPDCTEYRYLSQASGGDPRADIFEMWQSLLQMLSRFQPGDISFRIRGEYQPDRSAIQERLQWYLIIVIADSINEETITTLIEHGPISAYYEMIKSSKREFPTKHFKAVAEIIRSEETVPPQVPVELNENLKYVKLYYAVYPFEPKGQNDYLMLDRVLSQIKEKVIIEFCIRPVEEVPIRKTLIKYINHIMAINEGSEEIYLAGVQQKRTAGALGRGKEDIEYNYSKSQYKKDPISEEFISPLQELQAALREPHLQFDARVFAEKEQTATLVASTIAESGLSNGQYQLLTHSPKSEWFKALIGTLSNEEGFSRSYSREWFEKDPEGNWLILRLLARIAPVSQLTGLINLPVASTGSPRCMYKSSDPGAEEYSVYLKEEYGRNTGKTADGKKVHEKQIVIGNDLEMGILPDNRAPDDKKKVPLHNLLNQEFTKQPLSQFNLELFKKHIFIAGVPGSGKTVAVFNLLVQLHRHGIPFLVIEPAKTEYRILKAIGLHEDQSVRSLRKHLRVYTPGNENISPFRFNPLAYPKDDISLNEHIDAVLNSFKAGMEMWGPMEAIIGEALEGVYDDAEEDKFPTLVDLVEKIRTVVNSKGYAGDVLANVTAAIETRIVSLTRRSVGKIFAHNSSTPSVEELLSHPTIIEMDHMGTENACLLTMFLLSALRERIKGRKSGCSLQHVIVIEEAHNIVGQSSPQSGGEGQSSSKAFAAEYITRMLAELRALGEGIAIVDQLPSAVSPEVIKNTGTKLALRQVSGDDRELLGSTMLLNGQQVEELARLRVGEGFFYNEKLHSPRRVRCLNAYEYLGLSEKMYPDSKIVTSYLYLDNWFQQVLIDQLVHITELYKSFHMNIVELSRVLVAIQKQVADPDKLQEAEAQKLLIIMKWKVESAGKEMETVFNFIENEHSSVAERVTDWGEDLALEMLEVLDKEFEEHIVEEVESIASMIYDTIDRIESKQL